MGKDVLDAKSKLRWKKVGDPDLVRGLWRGKLMTDFIKAEGLLPAQEIEMLWNNAPKEIIQSQKAFANGLEIRSWSEWLDDLKKESLDLPSFCSSNSMKEVS